MLTSHSYVFILGAGAGKPYGLPLGDELYQFIRNNIWKQSRSQEIVVELKLFSRELKRTCGVSIDRYLNINKRLKDIGVFSITAAIHFFEIGSIPRLPFNDFPIEGDWYTYLYKKMIQGLETPDDLLRISENRVSFITFNYDRSLEHYLFSNLHGLLKNAGVQKETIATKCAEIPIIHVYGKTGYLPWEREFNPVDRMIVEYGSEKKPPGEMAIHTQEMIKLIYDERKETPELEKARKLISNADYIIFLGFGYDEMNLSILDFPSLSENKLVFGTALNSTKSEISQIGKKLRVGTSLPPLTIVNCDCLTLLREYLI